MSLRTRLAVSAAGLIAVVAALIGTATTIALHSHLQRQLDAQVTDIAHRAMRPPSDGDELGFVTAGGQRVGTLGALISGGDISYGVVSESPESADGRFGTTAKPLTGAQRDALDHVPADDREHTVELPGLGDYRVASQPTEAGTTVVVGLPMGEVQDTLGKLIVVEVVVAGAGLVAAGIVGSVMVGIALRPLRRVAATAVRVSELPLHQGEVRLRERMPERDTDTRTEVGQVGAALNRMLGHVESALEARQESETRVRQFVADASHELRTPLASIRGYAELTRRGREETGPDTRHALGRIESEASRMTGLVEDLLLLARLDAGRPLELTRTDLSPLVVDAVSDARAVGGDHEWRLDLPPEPVEVPGDPARLQQVLVNLLANARTHTPGGTTVTARVRLSVPGVADGEEAGAVVEVEDDGPGIPPGLLPRVFERFARGDASRSRAHGSTGLGLAIVQAVVAAHGGRVSVRSEPGRTAFRVWLPAAPGCEPLPGPTHRPRCRAAGSPAPSGSGQREPDDPRDDRDSHDHADDQAGPGL